MNKKDIKYRQGRSKRQVERNDKVGFAALLFFVITLGLTIIVSLVSSI